ncbi:MAG: carboxypeptidase-like regulatory domain-containing protein [Chlorobi bacterium]|nr:carboxypeptidase-like regulatory domain-containing protein [Chlorobiota bacterium]
MRFILISVLFLSFGFVTNGQDLDITARIIDSETKKGLAYANIMVSNQAIGTSSDTMGFFKLNLEDSLKNDTLVISYVGYQTREIPVSRISRAATIKLKSRIIKINEVVIIPSKKKIKPVIANRFKRKKCSVRYSPTDTTSKFWIPFRPKEPTIEAIYFPYENGYEETPRLKEIWLEVTNYKASTSSFNLRIFKSDANKKPGNDLLAEPINVLVTGAKQLIKVNLEKFNLFIPKNGLFVGFELLIIDKNKSVIQDKEGSDITLYSPYLNFYTSKNEQFFWLYSKGKWIKTSQTISNYLKKNLTLFYVPAISLVLSD